MSASSKRALPVPDELSEPFWAAALEGRLLIQRSPRTGKFQWYPRGHCLDDPSQTPEWVQVSGLGNVYAYSIIHRTGNPAVEPPFAIALVELDEGVVVTANLVGIDFEQVQIGMRVQLVFESISPEFSIPQFTGADT
jgi:uncharacterized protein